MLGRKNYTQDEFDQAKAALSAQVAAYRKLVKATTGDKPKKKVVQTVETFETLFFNNMVLVLDRYFVHRVRQVTGKDANALNEVELLSESLVNNHGVLRVGNALKFIPEETVLGLHPGDAIALSREDFERLSAAFFAELQRRFLDAAVVTGDH
jgi:hypothetical protein